MPIFRRTNCIITASGIVTLCKRLYGMPDENRLLCRLLSSGILYSLVFTLCVYCLSCYTEFIDVLNNLTNQKKSFCVLIWHT